MKILWLAHEANLSGANICFLEYLELLESRGIKNYLVCPHGTGSLTLKARALNIPVENIKYYSWTRPVHAKPSPISSRFRRRIRNHIAVKEVSALIKKIEPDFVVTNTIVTSIAAIAAKNTRKKHIWFVHEFGEEDHGFTIAGGFTNGAAIMNRLSYKMVFNSWAIRKKYKPFVADPKAFVVHNAVIIPEAGMQPFLKGSVFRLIILGQVAPSKHHFEALHALKICRDQGLKFNLEIVGRAEDAGYLNSLNAYIASEDLTGLVNLTGPSPEPVAILSQHHALLMCSHHEAFGRVTIEALKCGLPVIAANTGGSPEIIEEGKNGYLYKAGSAAGLAEKILHLYENYQLFNRAEIARQTREKYSKDHTVMQLLDVFN